MHLAHNRSDGKLVMVQVDPDYVFTKAERGYSHFIYLDQENLGSQRTDHAHQPDNFNLCAVRSDPAADSLHLRSEPQRAGQHGSR